MEQLVFNVLSRNEKGKKVRKNGYIPCVIYGDETHKAISVKMTKREMYRLLTYPKSSIISLKLDGDIKKCIVKDLQRDTFGHIEHIDFNSIRKGESVNLKMPITYIGEGDLEARGLRLEVLLSEIELQGEPTKFPKYINVDVSNYEKGREIFVNELLELRGLIPENEKDLEIAKVLSNYNGKTESEESTEK